MLFTSRLCVAALILGSPTLWAQTTIPGVTPLPGTGCAVDQSWPIAVSGSTNIGGTIQLDPSMPVFSEAVIVGAKRQDLPLEPLFGCGCTLVPDLTLVEFGFQLELELAIPNDPALIGARVWAQPWYYDSGLTLFACSLDGTGDAGTTFALGDAVEITVQP